MSNAIDHFDGRPKHDECSERRPTAAYRPEEAPNAKREQSNVNDDKTEAAILAD
jgi:hypothetical protein